MADNLDYDEEEEEQMTSEQKDAALLQAVKDNDYEYADELLKKNANVNAEKDGWNSILWASCNGNEEIVRLLIKNNAHQPYVDQS